MIGKINPSMLTKELDQSKGNIKIKIQKAKNINMITTYDKAIIKRIDRLL